MLKNCNKSPKSERLNIQVEKRRTIKRTHSATDWQSDR